MPSFFSQTTSSTNVTQLTKQVEAFLSKKFKEVEAKVQPYYSPVDKIDFTHLRKSPYVRQ